MSEKITGEERFMIKEENEVIKKPSLMFLILLPVQLLINFLAFHIGILVDSRIFFNPERVQDMPGHGAPVCTIVFPGIAFVVTLGVYIYTIVKLVNYFQMRSKYKKYIRESILTEAVINGVPWYDQNNQVVNAHGVGIIKENGRFYMFGEYKRDDKNSFNGFSCYSTENFANWNFEGMALSENTGDCLNGDRIGERVKVVKSKETQKFVMLMHTDSLKYDDPCICYAISDRVQEPYTFAGPLLYNGEPIRKWDMGTFVDDDNTSYLLTHEGFIYRLSDDCTYAEELIVSEVVPGGESPAMCRVGDTYYWMFSNKTSWERNDNYYYTAKSLYGPWKKQGLFCPEGTLTYDTQCSFILKYNFDGEDKYMYVGDRWSFPRQGAAATLVFLPLEFDEEQMEIPGYLEAWNIGIGELDTKKLKKEQIDFESGVKGESKVVSFSGTGIVLFGKLTKCGGYGKIEIINDKGRIVQENLVDFYSAYDMYGIRYVSPVLPQGDYQLRMTVLGEAGEWFKKDGTRFGSDGCMVCISEAAVVGHDTKVHQ